MSRIQFKTRRDDVVEAHGLKRQRFGLYRDRTINLISVWVSRYFKPFLPSIDWANNECRRFDSRSDKIWELLEYILGSLPRHVVARLFRSSLCPTCLGFWNVFVDERGSLAQYAWGLCSKFVMFMLICEDARLCLCLSWTVPCWNSWQYQRTWRWLS